MKALKQYMYILNVDVGLFGRFYNFEEMKTSQKIIENTLPEVVVVVVGEEVAGFVESKRY